MKSPEGALKRCLYPVVFAMWSGFLVYLLLNQRYLTFLRPEFGLLLALANVIAMAFLFASMIRSKTTQMDVPAVLRALVLLVPVLYFAVMPDTMLGNLAFKKRFIGTNNETIDQQEPSMLFSGESETNPGASVPPIEIGGSCQVSSKEPTILDIFNNPDHYIGQRVCITGMFLRDEQLKAHFGGRNTAVYRFLINCCAADALPLAIALDLDQDDAYTNDQWMQVDGIFDLQQVNGKPVPIVSKPRITLIEKPKMPYLYQLGNLR